MKSWMPHHKYSGFIIFAHISLTAPMRGLRRSSGVITGLFRFQIPIPHVGPSDASYSSMICFDTDTDLCSELTLMTNMRSLCCQIRLSVYSQNAMSYVLLICTLSERFLQS